MGCQELIFVCPYVNFSFFPLTIEVPISGHKNATEYIHKKEYTKKYKCVKNKQQAMDKKCIIELSIILFHTKL